MDTLSKTNDMNYADLRRDYVQLKDQHEQIQAAMQEKKSALELEFSKFMLLEAAKIDLNIETLFKRKRRGKTNGVGGAAKPIKPLYRDPANPANIWSGRGKPAKWLAAYIANGRSKEEFKIKDVGPGGDNVAQAPDKDISRDKKKANRAEPIDSAAKEAAQPRDKK